MLKFFANSAELNDEIVNILQSNIFSIKEKKEAIMLCGGSTPMKIYQQLSLPAGHDSSNLHLIQSDERYSPDQPELANFLGQKNLIQSLNLDPANFLHVDRQLPLPTAVSKYDQQLENFITNQGTIKLALLGLGEDGHFASLFSQEDITKSKGKNAIAVTAPDAIQRISLSLELIIKAEKIRFMICGVRKKEIIKLLETEPNKVLAYQALEHHPNLKFLISKDS